MNKIDFTEQIKSDARKLGADLCGISPISRFDECIKQGTLSLQNSPSNIFPEAKSVIVVAKKFLRSTSNVYDTVPYTVVRNWISSEMDRITIQLSGIIDELDPKSQSFPTGAIGPDTWNSHINKMTGMISLKNAARLAGLGVIGKNTLLLTPQFGNMVWLGAVITSAELEGDKLITEENNPCTKNCNICISSCPTHALDERSEEINSPFIDQKACAHFAFGEPESGGEWRIKCNKCRIICPYSSTGFKIIW